MDDSQVRAAKIAAAATVVAALIGLLAVLIPRIGGDGNGTPKSKDGQVVTPTNIPTVIPGPGNASVFLNTTSAPAGSTIKVSGSGFAPNEEVVIRIQAQEVGTTTANGEGKFENVAVTVPSSLSVFAPQQFDVTATGRTSILSDSAPFTVSG